MQLPDGVKARIHLLMSRLGTSQSWPPILGYPVTQEEAKKLADLFIWDFETDEHSTAGFLRSLREVLESICERQKSNLAERDSSFTFLRDMRGNWRTSRPSTEHLEKWLEKAKV